MNQCTAHPQDLPKIQKQNYSKLHEDDSIFRSEYHSLYEGVQQKNLDLLTSGCIKNKTRNKRQIKACHHP